MLLMGRSHSHLSPLTPHPTFPLLRPTEAHFGGFVSVCAFSLSLCVPVPPQLGMASSTSKRWAKTISRFACQIYFIVIIFQIPLFGFPCGIGICTNPIELTLAQLVASEALPAGLIKILLYPGDLAKSIIKNRTIPSYNNPLKYRKFTNMRVDAETIDFKHIEVLAGSYFSVAGAFLGLIVPGRMSIVGILLIIWGIAKEVIFGKHTAKNHSKVVCIYWTMSIAVLSAFLTVRGDVRKLIRSFKVKCFFNPVKNYSKTKYK